MKRLFPDRTINPYDEINQYALADTYVNQSTSGTGFGDEGVFVTVQAGDLNLDPTTFGADSYLGKTDYNAVGFNQRSSVSLKCRPAASGDACLGVTLWETALYDENGEYLSRYPQKALEQGVVLKGKAVPVLTRGVIHLSKFAVDGTLTPGLGFKLSTVSGKVTGCTVADSARIGLVLASGTRGTRGTYVDAYSGVHYQVKLGL